MPDDAMFQYSKGGRFAHLAEANRGPRQRPAALVSSEWVAEAEAEAIQAKRKVEDAYAAYLVAKRYYDRVAAVAGNRRGVRDKRSYTPFPGVGTEL